MPFDVLPHHRIVLPEVQFYHPSPELARIAVDAAWQRTHTILGSLDKLLDAADPMKIQQRRLALQEAQLRMEMLPLKKEELQFEIDYRRKHGGIGPPTSYSEAISRQKFEQNESNAALVDDALHPGQQTTSKYRADGARPRWEQAAQAIKEREQRAGEKFESRLPGGEQLQMVLPEFQRLQPPPPTTTTTDQTQGDTTAAPTPTPSTTTGVAYSEDEDNYVQGVV
jgi:hypothetical protein